MTQAARALAAPFRLLTPLGRGVLATGVVATVVAAQLHWQEFAQLAVVAFALLALAIVWQLLPGAPSGRLRLPHPRTVDGTAPPSAHLEVEAGAMPMLFPRVVVPVGWRAVQLRLPFLSAFARHSEVVELPVMPRGVHAVGPLTYEKTDVVGLVSRRFEVGTSQDLFVSPRVVELSVFAGGMTNDLDGSTSQQLSMSDLAFHALREYVPGDDLRHVHWRSSAKAGELLVRQYHESRRGQVTVLLDDSTASYRRTRDFELAVSVATSIALRGVRDDFDTYLRCGPVLARSRSDVAMTDAACRFALVPDDDYLMHATAAAESLGGTGLVVQVTGAARDLIDLDTAATRFGRGLDWMVVRADGEAEPSVRDSGMLREITVPDLDRLQELLARGRR